MSKMEKMGIDACILDLPLCFSLQVYIWVLNEDHEYKRAFDLGATGVMTDYPTKLKTFLHHYAA